MTELLSIKECAALTSYSQGAIYRLIIDGKLPAHRISPTSPYRIEKAELLLLFGINEQPEVHELSEEEQDKRVWERIEREKKRGSLCSKSL